MLLLLDDEKATGRPPLSVLCVDKVKPPSACQLTDAFLRAHPSLRSRHRFAEGDLGDLVTGDRGPRTLLVSLHGCGRLSDRVIELAFKSRASIALVPCCQVTTSPDTLILCYAMR